MNDKIKSDTPLNVAVLVRMFPNIVQTYVLNHILSLRKSGARTLIIAEGNPHQKEVHPRIQEYRLLDETVYINTERSNLFQ